MEGQRTARVEAGATAEGQGTARVPVSASVSASEWQEKAVIGCGTRKPQRKCLEVGRIRKTTCTSRDDVHGSLCSGAYGHPPWRR